MNSIAPQIDWPVAPARVQLGEREIHLWAASLQPSPAESAILSEPLSNDERDRAARFKFDLHRNRYIAGRGTLRLILSRYLEIEPASLEFAYTASGKPELNRAGAAAGIHFNLGHSGDLAVFAVTKAGSVGVDTEQIRVVKDAKDLVARFFSPRENELFRQLTSDQQPEAFFNLWTRKEALLKATGEGITGGLNKVEVSFLAAEPARLLAIAGDSTKAREWTLASFIPAAGFVGAVAIPSPDVPIHFWKLS